jgi:hypothetical protein
LFKKQSKDYVEPCQIRNKQGNNNELPLNIEGETVTGFHELANMFNDYFVNATRSVQVENFDNTPSALDNLNSACTKYFP